MRVSIQASRKTELKREDMLWDKATNKGREAGGRQAGARVEWAAHVQQVQAAHVIVRNADTVNHTSAAYPACRSNARNAGLR
jgi:hypothetical protein